ncbi:type 1 glutamine amidotransferase [Szabonella alba]|uniref:Type 1 glutamine amidotransferase n=1 Tax=Szabonella alba TaxID=2804194 RepID=A0A8K0VF82_9RHOB|nr:type 1 glutamine amidotransferase [Szabonella alba]MBL4918222.1 type 1 glutamine amidotransferase [Szabonella alba]
MLIGILQTGAAPDQLKPDSGDYPDMFQLLLAEQGFTFRTWRVEVMDFPPDIHAADGWLITGSRHGAYEDHAFIPPLEDFIRTAYGAHVPVVGICFGHQIIAQAMGGKVEQYDKGWSVGATDYDFEGQTLTLNAWHRDQVTQVPQGAKVVATNGFCANAALLYDDRMFTVQAHPEFPPAFVEGLMRTRGPGLVPDPLMQAARARLADPLDAGSIAKRIGAFFRAARQAGQQDAEAAHG